MRKLIFKFSQLFVALLALSLLFACFPTPFLSPSIQPQNVLSPSNTPNSYRKTYPNAEFILYSDLERVSVNPDGTSIATDEMVYLILTEKGRRELRSIPLAFNPVYESLAITEFAIERSGQKFPIPLEGNSSISIDHRQMSSNIFDPNHKVLRLNVPDLQIDDKLYLTIRTDTHKLRIPGVFTDFIVLQGEAPTINYQIEVNTPLSLPLQAIAIKGPGKDSVKSTFQQIDGRNYYSWVATNLPQLIPEPNMPDMYSNATRVLLSTVPDWSTISKWYFDLCRKPIADVTPEMIDFVNSLKEKLDNDPEKLKAALFRLVSQDIRYMGSTPEQEAPGYEPHPVSMTFNDRAGVCRDKAALLVALFNLAGFESYPVLFMAGPLKDNEVPNSYFNHAIVAIKTDSNYQLFDPTFENTRDYLPGYEAEMSYLVAAPYGETLLRSPAVNAELNQTVINQKLSLNNTGMLSGNVGFTFYGSDDTAYRSGLARMNPEKQSAWINGLLQSVIPGAILTGYESFPVELRDTSQPLKVNFSFAAPEFLRPDNIAQSIDAPNFGKNLGNLAFLPGSEYLKTRVFPMQMDTTASQTERIEWSFAPEIQILERPVDKYNLDGTALKVNASWQNTRYNSQAKWVKTVIESEKYAKHRQELSEWKRQNLRSFVLTLNSIQDSTEKILRLDTPSVADLEFSNLRIVASLDPKTKIFSKEVSNEIKILNYNGLKSASELKISYNEAFDSALFIKGEVESPDGTIIPVSPEAVKIMDSPQNNTAPGHAPMRILVVNFPSVQVGSIIRYTTMQTEKNRTEYSLRIPLISSGSVYTKRLSILVKTPDGRENNNEFVDLDFLPLEPRSAPLDSWAEFFDFRSSVGDFFSSMQTRLNLASQADSSIEILANKLRGLNDAESVQTLRNYIAINLRHAGPETNNARQEEITAAPEVIQRGYGSAFDHVSLYKSILDLWGIKHQVLLVMSNDFAPKADFMPQRITSVLIRTANGEFLGLDSQYSDIYSTTWGGYTAYDLENREMSVLPFLDKTVNKTTLTLEPNLSANITQVLQFWGQSSSAPRRNWLETSPELLSRQMQQRTYQTNPSAEVVSYRANEIKNGFESFISYNIASPVSNSDQFLSIDNIWSLDALAPHYQGRKTPVMATDTANEWQLEIIIPQTIEVVSVPKSIDFDKYGVRLTLKVAQEDHRIVITSSLTTTSQLWSAAEAEELGDLRAKLLAKDNSILLKAKNR